MWQRVLSINKKTTVILCAAVCVKRHMKPSPASERRLLLFPPLLLSLSMAYKSVDVCVCGHGCVSVFTTQGSSVLYSEAGLK